MPDQTFHFEIVSPEGVVYKDDVDEVLLPTPNGEIGILPHHVPLFTKLTGGEVRIKSGSKTISVAITGGFLEVSNNQVSVASDYAIRAENIEVARAQEAKKRAEQILEEKKETTDFTLISRDLQKSILELDIAEKIKRRR